MVLWFNFLDFLKKISQLYKKNRKTTYMLFLKVRKNGTGGGGTHAKNNFQPGTFAKKEHPTDCMKFNFVHTRVLGITFSVTSHYYTTEPPANGERWWRLYTN